MAEHELKCWRLPFAAVLDGRKRFEIRKADRAFCVGDVLRLREWHNGRELYTGRSVEVMVTYLVRPGEWGPPGDLCVMGISLPATPPIVHRDAKPKEASRGK